MRKLLGAAVLLTALAAFGVTAAGAKTAGTDRPFKGTLIGSAVAVPDTTCPLGFRTVSEAPTGTASHLGRISMGASHCFDLPNLMTQGRMSLVAANGDELDMTYAGTCDPGIPSPGDLVTCSADNVIAGGTGRFVDATGEVQLTGLVEFEGFGVPWPATWTWHGTMSY
jgi:hypothetical protein